MALGWRFLRELTFNGGKIMLTRKDYQQIAQAIFESKTDKDDLGEKLGTAQAKADELEALDCCSNFDRARFIHWCMTGRDIPRKGR